MKNKKEIAELLPNKEDFSLNKAAAASIWVKDFNQGYIARKQLIFGISSSSSLSKNFINLKKNNLINNSYFYIKNFISKLPKSIKVIVIHNRPHFFFILKKKFPEIKFILVFHNDPNTLRGSRSVKDKINILQNCDKIIFVSSYVKKRFYHNINDLLPIKITGIFSKISVSLSATFCIDLIFLLICICFISVAAAAVSPVSQSNLDFPDKIYQKLGQKIGFLIWNNGKSR